MPGTATAPPSGQMEALRLSGDRGGRWVPSLSPGSRRPLGAHRGRGRMEKTVREMNDTARAQPGASRLVFLCPALAPWSRLRATARATLLNHVLPCSDSPWLPPPSEKSLRGPNCPDLTPSLTSPPFYRLLPSRPTGLFTTSPSPSHTPAWDLHTHYSSSWNVLLVHSSLSSNVTSSEFSDPPHQLLSLYCTLLSTALANS